MDTSKTTSSNLSRGKLAIVGLVVVFLIILLVNYIFSIVNARFDLTEDKIYTLADGTESILERLDTPVTVRYFVEDEDDQLTPQEKAASERVESLLAEYSKIGGDMLIVEKLNPEPDTDAEDSATLDGLTRGQSQLSGNQFFMGITVKCVDAVEKIPFVLTRPETLLEYDLSRAIARVHDGSTNNIRVLTSMEVGGSASMGMPMAQPAPAWFFMEDMKRDNNVETLNGQTTDIPSDTDLLVVLHPYDITEETQFAIDQYLLQGGNVVAIVDPSFFFGPQLAPPPASPMMPPQGGPGQTSDLDKLFSAWGIDYAPDRVIADAVYQMQLQSGYAMTALTVTESGMNQDSPITSNLSDLLLITPGAFEVSPPEGVEYEPLVFSSEQNQLVTSVQADPLDQAQVESIRKSFQPSGEQKALAVRLTGNFKTAFPDGNPAAAAEEEASDDAEAEESEETSEEAEVDKKEAAPVADDSLKTSQKPGTVIAIADADFIYDAAYMQAQNFMGQQIVQIHHGANINLLQNSIDLLLGADELIQIRKRNSSVRSFVKMNDWLREAEAKFRDQETEYQDVQRKAEERINEILQQNPENLEDAIIGQEVQDELQNLRKENARVSKQIREIRKDVRKDFESRLNAIKFTNIFLCAGLVLITGLVLFFKRRLSQAAR